MDSSHKRSPLSKLSCLASRLQSLVLSWKLCTSQKRASRRLISSGCHFPDNSQCLFSSHHIVKFGIEQRGAIAGDLCPKNLSNHPFGVRNALSVLTGRVWCTEPKANHRDANTCLLVFGEWNTWDRAFGEWKRHYANSICAKSLGSESGFWFECLLHLLPGVWP